MMCMSLSKTRNPCLAMIEPPFEASGTRSCRMRTRPVSRSTTTTMRCLVFSPKVGALLALAIVAGAMSTTVTKSAAQSAPALRRCNRRRFRRRAWQTSCASCPRPIEKHEHEESEFPIHRDDGKRACGSSVARFGLPRRLRPRSPTQPGVNYDQQNRAWNAGLGDVDPASVASEQTGGLWIFRFRALPNAAPFSFTGDTLKGVDWHTLVELTGVNDPTPVVAGVSGAHAGLSANPPNASCRTFTSIERRIDIQGRQDARPMVVGAEQLLIARDDEDARPAGSVMMKNVSSSIARTTMRPTSAGCIPRYALPAPRRHARRGRRIVPAGSARSGVSWSRPAPGRSTEMPIRSVEAGAQDLGASEHGPLAGAVRAADPSRQSSCSATTDAVSTATCAGAPWAFIAGRNASLITLNVPASRSRS